MTEFDRIGVGLEGTPLAEEELEQLQIRGMACRTSKSDESRMLGRAIDRLVAEVRRLREATKDADLLRERMRVEEGKVDLLEGPVDPVERLNASPALSDDDLAKVGRLLAWPKGWGVLLWEQKALYAEVRRLRRPKVGGGGSGGGPDW